MTKDIVKSLTPSVKAGGHGGGGGLFHSSFLNLYACSVSIITHLARFFCLSPANGGSIRYVRDSLGRVEKVSVKADKNAPDFTAYITEYGYDPNCNLEKVKATSGNGQALETAMVYDEVNRLKERTLPNG